MRPLRGVPPFWIPAFAGMTILKPSPDLGSLLPVGMDAVDDGRCGDARRRGKPLPSFRYSPFS